MPGRARALVVSLAVAAAFPATASAQAPRDPCAGIPGARCATLDVPLDATGAVPGTQRLGYMLLSATGTSSGTLAVVLGGPGQASTPIARSVARVLAPVRADHDLLLVDQRGTGLSGAVSCPGLARTITPAAIRACAEGLGAQRQFLTTRADALDLEAVRAALGIEKLSVLGVSYGTSVAGYYARLFPQRVDRLALDSPEPIEGADALDSLRQLALPRVLREVCWPPSCRSFLAADPVSSIATLTARLAKKPMSGTVVTASGRRVRGRLSATLLYVLAASSDVDPFLRTRIPSAVASALRGDAAPLLRLGAGLATTDVPSGEVNPVRLLATSCVDDRLPWDPAGPTAGRARALDDEVARRPAGAWAPFSPLSILSASVAGVCAEWPPTPTAERVPSQGPDMPALVLAGRDDLRTPLEDARRTASQYPSARVLAIPDTGHSVLASDPTPCAVTGLTAFLAGRPVARCTRTARKPDLFPYVPAGAGKLHGIPKLPAAEGRTATAVGATLLDALRRAVALKEAGGTRSGGLRAGTLRLAGGHATLAGYSVVRGIAVSGTLSLTATGAGTLTVSGPAAAPARLSMKGSRLTGRLGTFTVRLRVVL